MNFDLTNALSGTVFSPTASYTPQQLVGVAVSGLFATGSGGAFIVLLIGAVQWIMAGGDKEGLEKARKKIVGALVGLTILFSIYALIFLINSIFQVNILQLCIPSINGGGCVSSSSGGSGGSGGGATPAPIPNISCPAGQKFNNCSWCTRQVDCNNSGLTNKMSISGVAYCPSGYTDGSGFHLDVRCCGCQP